MKVGRLARSKDVRDKRQAVVDRDAKRQTTRAEEPPLNPESGLRRSSARGDRCRRCGATASSVCWSPRGSLVPRLMVTYVACHFRCTG